MDSLPEEILLHYVFIHLSAADLLSLALVSSVYRWIANEFSLWQPFFEQQKVKVVCWYIPEIREDVTTTLVTQDKNGNVDWRLEFLVRQFIQNHMVQPWQGSYLDTHTYLRHAPTNHSVCIHCSCLIEKGFLRSPVDLGGGIVRFVHASCLFQQIYPFESCSPSSSSSSPSPSIISPWKRRGMNGERTYSLSFTFVSYAVKQEIVLWMTRGMLDEDTPHILGPSCQNPERFCGFETPKKKRKKTRKIKSRLTYRKGGRKKQKRRSLP
ncbi:hypothetical protein QOT17_015709 [Balamuthia mandrillaris]